MAQTPQQDSLALVAIYNATGGTHWTNNTNWLKPGQKVSTWYGVTVGNLNHVSELNLYQNNLTGTLPDAIGNLTQVVSMTLAGNHLSGTIPRSLSTLTRLGFIALFDNDYTGEMPTFLFTLPAIQYVFLGDNAYTSTAPPEGRSSSLINAFIENNLFDFADLEPFFNPGFRGLQYAPQPDIYTTAQVTLREGATLTLNAATPGTVNQYKWLKDGIAISGANEANYTKTIVLADAGSYTAEVTNTKATSLTLTRNPITLSVKKDTVYISCDGASITLDATITDPQATYRWSTGATTPTAVVSTSGKYVVDIETSNYTIKDTLEVVIPTTLALGPDVDLCAASVALTSNVEGTNYSWKLPDGSTVTNQRSITATLDGPYILILEQQQCVQRDTIGVVLNRFTKGEFTVSAGDAAVLVDYRALTRVPLTFTNISGTGKDFSWSFGDGETSSVDEPTHSYAKAGSYAVTLSGTDSRNCAITETKTIFLEDLLITNAITPNGDGQNDKLFIEPFLYRAELKVVNRWGQEVYQTSSYHNDFTGANLESGVYYYELYFKEIEKSYKGYFHIMK